MTGQLTFILPNNIFYVRQSSTCFIHAIAATWVIRDMKPQAQPESIVLDADEESNSLCDLQTRRDEK